VLSPAELSRAQRLARAYLAKLAPAVEGQGGDKQTFKAACYLVIDFGLTPEQALPLLMEWNGTHCKPRWTEADLVHKLREADKRPGERGRLLKRHGHDARDWAGRDGEDGIPEGREHQGDARGATVGGAPFLGQVPDFVEADWEKARPRPVARRRGRPRVGGGLRWLTHLCVIQQRKAAVVIPDVLAAQVVWGGDRAAWPSHWRRRLQVLLYGKPAQGKEKEWQEKRRPTPACPAGCPLHGRIDAPHRHFWVKLRTLAEVGLSESDLGVLERSCVSREGERRYNFKEPAP
jgi:hypothetical protein